MKNCTTHHICDCLQERLETAEQRVLLLKDALLKIEEVESKRFREFTVASELISDEIKKVLKKWNL